MKRLLALVLTLTMLISALPPAVHATGDGTLKILAIGNGFSEDATEYFYNVAQAEGLNVVLGVASYSGGTLQQHAAFAQSGAAVYRYYKNGSGAWNITRNVTLLSCITDEAWDVICLQQGADAAAQPAAYSGLDALVEYIDAHKTNAEAKYAWHMTWAYQAGYPTEAFTAESQMTMYENISEAVQQVIASRDEFEYVIPVGTAIQDARSSLLGDALTTDGHSLNGVGKLIAAYTWYSVLTEIQPAALNYAVADGETLSAVNQSVVLETVGNAVTDPYSFTQSRYTAGRDTHYTFTLKGDSPQNYSALPTNVTYEGPGYTNNPAATLARQMLTGSYYGAGGRVAFTSYTLENGTGTSTAYFCTACNKLPKQTGLTVDSDCPSCGASGSLEKRTYHHGLPYRTIEYNDTTKTVADDVLWFELGKMPALNTAGKAAVNLSITYPHAFLIGTGGAAYQRNLLVQVSLDGSTYLPGYAGVRSAKLLGGGSVGGSQIMVYTLETENLLDIPGVAGNTIKMIRILPYGDHDRPMGRHHINKIMVNTYDTLEAFQINVPCDLETVDVGEEAMRSIVVTEALRTATTPWRTKTNMHTTFNDGSNHCYYASTKYMVGPTYERDIDSTRELFASGIDSTGYWGANGAGFTIDDNGKNTAYGMDCQAFVWNAIARVSRNYGWAIPYYFGDTYMRLLGDLNDLHDTYYYSDADVIASHTPEQMYAAYAQVQPGDVIAQYKWVGGTHTRIVKSVNVVYNTDGSINPDESKIYSTEQASIPAWLDENYNYISYSSTKPSNAVYWASSRANSIHSFSTLLSSSYVPFTLTDYADGKIARENVQVVAGPLVAGGALTDGVNIAIASNYRLVKYTVTLKNLNTNSNVFSKTVWNKDARRAWVNDTDSTLNGALADLTDGSYRLSISVDSGPLLSTTQTQVPTTVKNYDFVVGTGTGMPCSGGVHSGDWTPVSTAADFGTLKGSGTNSYYQIAAGKYYLTDNVTTDYQLNIASGATICLNGYTLTGANTTKYRNNFFVNVSGTGAFNLCDCSAAHTGTVTLNPQPTTQVEGIVINASANVFNFYGGTLTGFNTRSGVIRGIGTVNMYEDAAILNNNCSATVMSNQNSAVQMYSTSTGNGTTTFNMYGGTISGNTGCAAVCLNPNINNTNLKAPTTPGSAVFNMYGGTISGNTATLNSYSAPIVQRPTGGGSSVVNVYGGVISDNTGTAAGAVNMQSGTAFNLYGGLISGNTASAQGGALRLAGSSTLPAVLEMTGGSITGNSAPTNGGGLSVGAYGQFEFSDGVISGNSAPIGGGVCLTSANASLTLSADAEISGNTASDQGGGIAVTDGAVNLPGGLITGNTATNQGGGVSVTGGSVTAAGVTVSENTVTGEDGKGGGVSVTGSTATVLLTHGATLSGNSAKYGAALHVAQDAVTMTGGSITGNNGEGDGAVYLTDGATLTLSGGSVTGNSTATSAVYVAGAALDMSGGSITGNTSAANGGGATLGAGGVLTLTGGEISGNTGTLGQDVFLAGNNAKLNMTAGQIGTGNTGATVWSVIADGETATANIYGGTVATAVGHGANHADADYDINVFGGNVYSVSSAEDTHEDIKFHRGYTSADELTLKAVVARAGGGSENIFPGGSSGYTYQVEPDYNQKANMLLSDDLTFYVRLADNNAWTTHTLVDGSDLAVTRTPTTATVSMPGRVLPFDVTVEKDTETGTLVIPVPIYAKEMADTVTVTVKDSGGEIETFTDSVREYAGRILTDENATATEKTLMVDMLNYGAAAQEYFSYGTEDLANALLTGAQSALASTASLAYTEGNTTHPLAYHSANLTLEERIDFAMYFWTARIGEDKSYTYTVKNGSATVTEGNGTFGDKLDGADGYLYEVHIPNLNLSAMSRAVISLTYQDKDGNTYTAKDSLANYLYRNDGLAINDTPQSYTINNDGSINTEGPKAGTDGSDLYAKVMAFAASSAQYAEETQVLCYELQDGDVIFIPGAAKSGKDSTAYILNSATQPAGTKAVVTVPAGTVYADGTTPASSSNQSSGRFWMMNGSTLTCARGVWVDSSSVTAYKFGYHDAISSYTSSTVTLKHAAGHTGTYKNDGCTYRVDTACGQTTNNRYRECARKQNVTDATLILDLRSAVLAGTEDEVTTLAQIKALTDAGTAIINVYVPDGVAVGSSNSGTGSAGGTAAAIIVIDHSPA